MKKSIISLCGLKENKEISKVHEKNIQKQPKKYR